MAVLHKIGKSRSAVGPAKGEVLEDIFSVGDVGNREGQRCRRTGTGTNQSPARVPVQQSRQLASAQRKHVVSLRIIDKSRKWWSGVRYPSYKCPSEGDITFCSAFAKIVSDFYGLKNTRRIKIMPSVSFEHVSSCRENFDHFLILFAKL